MGILFKFVPFHSIMAWLALVKALYWMNRYKFEWGTGRIRWTSRRKPKKWGYNTLFGYVKASYPFIMFATWDSQWLLDAKITGEWDLTDHACLRDSLRTGRYKISLIYKNINFQSAWCPFVLSFSVFFLLFFLLIFHHMGNMSHFSYTIKWIHSWTRGWAQYIVYIYILNSYFNTHSTI